MTSMVAGLGRCRAVLGVVLVAVLVAGCASSPEPAPTVTGTPSDASASASSAPTPATPTTTATPATTETPRPQPRGFVTSSRPLRAGERQAMVGVTWHEGCPVGLDELRRVRLAFHNFAGARRIGVLVVHAEVVAQVQDAFRAIYRSGFRIRAMVPIEAYDGDDAASIEADNTSAFNCRNAVGGNDWSNHAYGYAIDINPLENPYVYGDLAAEHPRSVPYLDRTRARRGVIMADGPVVAAFDAVGWYWGGRWSSVKDYQHFASRNG